MVCTVGSELICSSVLLPSPVRNHSKHVGLEVAHIPLAIAVPMGMLSTGQFDWTLPSPDILDALSNAEKLLWSHLNLMSQKGSVVKVREAAISLALVGAFQTSLGNQRNGVPWAIASLLGMCQSANVVYKLRSWPVLRCFNRP
jgi:hypothetical protein